MGADGVPTTLHFCASARVSDAAQRAYLSCLRLCWLPESLFLRPLTFVALVDSFGKSVRGALLGAGPGLGCFRTRLSRPLMWPSPSGSIPDGGPLRLLGAVPLAFEALARSARAFAVAAAASAAAAAAALASAAAATSTAAAAAAAAAAATSAASAAAAATASAAASASATAALASASAAAALASASAVTSAAAAPAAPAAPPSSKRRKR